MRGLVSSKERVGGEAATVGRRPQQWATVAIREGGRARVGRLGGGDGEGRRHQGFGGREAS